MSHHTVSEYSACRVPLRRISWCGVFLTTHEGCVASLKRIEARYYGLNGPARYPIRQGDTASYVCRKIAGSSSWSKHSWGCAIDTNWSTNGYGASHHDLPMWFVQLFLDEHWGWGGNWSGKKDWMHVSKFPNEGGDGKLESPDEEDDVTDQDHAKITAAITAAVKPIAARLAEVEKVLGVGQPYAAKSNVMKALLRGGADGTYTEEVHDVYLAVQELLARP